MNIFVPMKGLLSGLVRKIENNKNDILHYTGIACEAGALVYAISKSAEAVRICEEGAKKEAKVYLSEPDEKKIPKKQLAIKGETGIKLLETYFPVAILFGTSVYCNNKSYNNLKDENAELIEKIAIGGALLAGYRGRVADKIGAEAEEELYFETHKERIEIEQEQEDGSSKSVKKSVSVLPNDSNEENKLEPYQFWFTPETSTKYIRSSRTGLHNANTDLFKSCEQYSTMALIARASTGDMFLSLDYPLEYLGMDGEKSKYSYNAGWTYDKLNPRGDNCVKIAYKEFWRAERYFDDLTQNTETRYIPIYLIEFNVDGKISDCPGRKER